MKFQAICGIFYHQKAPLLLHAVSTKKIKTTKYNEKFLYDSLDSLKSGPGDNISTLLEKKWNSVCKSENIQTLNYKPESFMNVVIGLIAKETET